MVRHLILGLVAVSLLTACTTHDEQYYRTNPPALQQAIKDCSEQSSGQLTCDQLKAIAADVSQLAYELQINPQAFGKKIISLQNQMVAIQAQLKQNPNQTELTQSLHTVEQELKDRLAIVKWLESPQG